MKKNCSSVQLLTVCSGTAGKDSKTAGAEKVARRIERMVKLLGAHLPGLRKLASTFAFEETLEN